MPFSTCPASLENVHSHEVLINHWTIYFPVCGVERKELKHRTSLEQDKDSQGAGFQGPSRKPNHADTQ